MISWRDLRVRMVRLMLIPLPPGDRRITVARIVGELRGLQDVTINLNGHQIAAQSQPTPIAVSVLKSSTPPGH